LPLTVLFLRTSEYHTHTGHKSMSPENHEMAHGPTIGTAPTSNESNKNVVTWRALGII
jgi:hypothetical protein